MEMEMERFAFLPLCPVESRARSEAVRSVRGRRTEIL